MPHRVVLLHALDSLDRGNILTYKPTGFTLIYLENCEFVHCVVDTMLKNQWIKPVDDSDNYYTITEKGRGVLYRGKQLYRQLPWHKKALSRFISVNWGGDDLIDEPIPQRVNLEA